MKAHKLKRILTVKSFIHLPMTSPQYEFVFAFWSKACFTKFYFSGRQDSFHWSQWRGATRQPTNITCLMYCEKKSSTLVSNERRGREKVG